MGYKAFIILTTALMCAGIQTSHAQAAPIDSAERESERKRWNSDLLDTSYHFNKAPNAYLAQAIQDRKPGRALDVAMGQGRNALYLARMGWTVTGYDIADEALMYARNEADRQHLSLTTVQEGSEEFDFGTAQWDLISFIYAGCIEDVPGLATRMAKGLKPGGIIVFEFFHRDAGIAMKQSDFGCPANAEKEVILKAPGMKIISYQEKMGISDYGLEMNKMVYLIAEKK